MWPSASSAPPPFLLIGTPGDRRVTLFQEALARLSLPPARLLSYEELLAGGATLAGALTPETIVRIESPGKSLAVERALLARGAEVTDPEGESYQRLSRAELAALPQEKGRLLPLRQWYLGFCSLLTELEEQLGNCEALNSPAAIRLQFDKRACHALLQAANVPVPRALGTTSPPANYEALLTLMRESGCSRVFVKPAHGSSASGIVAYRYTGARHQALSTVEMVRDAYWLRLYNTRKIQEYRDQAEIAQLIDALCQQRVHVEDWLPKVDYMNKSCDLRVVVIAGRVRHVVARLSESPMTNLHLLNQRGDTQALLARLGPRWEAARTSCERAADLLKSLYTGIDLLFTPGFSSHAILEMNAFGDLLPGLLSEGEDTYTAEIHATLERRGECFTRAS